MLKRFMNWCRNLKITIKFYVFLWKLGVLKEYIEAVKDNDINGKYTGIMTRLNRDLRPDMLVIASFSFAKQTHVRYSQTNWWSINNVWNVTCKTI